MLASLNFAFVTSLWPLPLVGFWSVWICQARDRILTPFFSSAFLINSFETFRLTAMASIVSPLSYRVPILSGSAKDSEAYLQTLLQKVFVMPRFSIRNLWYEYLLSNSLPQVWQISVIGACLCCVMYLLYHTETTVSTHE